MSRGRITVWALLDDDADEAAQVLGVAEALALPFERKKLDYTAAAALPNLVMMASFGGLTQACRVNLTPPWPDLVIAAGRRAAPVAKHIKGLSGGRARLVHLGHPGESDLAPYDLVITGQHDVASDSAPAGHQLAITGVCHRLSVARLEAEAVRWRDTFAGLPRPHIALLVGGDAPRRRLTPELAEALAAAAQDMAAQAGGTLLVSTGARASAEATTALEAHLKPPFTIHHQGDDSPSPAVGYLAVADGVIVTGESATLCSEACATTVPVWIFAPRQLVAGKQRRMVEDLCQRYQARLFVPGTRFAGGSRRRLESSEQVAAAIVHRLGL